MKRTLIKRKPLRATAKALRAKTYRIPIHGKKWKPMPKEVLKIVCRRDGGTWDDKNDVAIPPKRCIYCAEPLNKFYGFDFAHREHRGLGGRFNSEWERINSDPDNYSYIPRVCHDRIDGRDFKELDNMEAWRIKHGCKAKI